MITFDQGQVVGHLTMGLTTRHHLLKVTIYHGSSRRDDSKYIALFLPRLTVFAILTDAENNL